CNLTYLTTIQDFDVFEHDSSGAILFRAKFAIDADGSPRAYGPNNSGLDWTANAGYPGNWWGIVTDPSGNPIIQSTGEPYPGMYVSTTSLVRAGYSNYSTFRYVDSENIPFIALPSSLQSLANISKGDLAYSKNITNGNTSYAYLADTGPGGKLGEGSMDLATKLGINNNPRTGGTTLPIIDYVVFPQSGFGQGTHLTAAEIDSIGQLVLNAAGGIGLIDCLDDQFPSLDCSAAVPLSCGLTYVGPSSNAASSIDLYGCNSWTETGPERVHTITPGTSGSITANISNFSGDLDVYILGSCDPYDCLGTVSSSAATFGNAIAGQTYYIVVDADDGSGSGYDLEVSCPVTTNKTEVFKSNNIILYPNPTGGIVNFKSGDQKFEKVIMLNALGIEIEVFTPNNNSINIERFPAGIYFFKFTDDNKHQSIFKIVRK
ncbi:T9SS type A sorting domain-containing protein, partial [Aureispira]|nr:T9SS type A sorting domain-containing protein [Aureispira sp.]